MANAGFGKMTDWFGMESAALKLVASDSGDTRSIVYASQVGKIAGVSDCGSEASGILRNPSCTYEVVANTTISATLGAAWAAASGVSGYMLTNVTIRTPFAAFPQVTFTAVANEGENAINQFAISVPILGRARPQNLLGAISGGGDLQDFTLTASCDPVVLFEGLMPCASDVTHGKLTASGTTAAYADEAAPTSENGFTFTAIPAIGGGVDYKTFTFNAEKGI